MNERASGLGYHAAFMHRQLMQHSHTASSCSIHTPPSGSVSPSELHGMVTKSRLFRRTVTPLSGSGYYIATSSSTTASVSRAGLLQTDGGCVVCHGPVVLRALSLPSTSSISGTRGNRSFLAMGTVVRSFRDISSSDRQYPF